MECPTPAMAGEHNLGYRAFHLPPRMFGANPYKHIKSVERQRGEWRINTHLKERRNKREEESPSKKYNAGVFWVAACNSPCTAFLAGTDKTW